MSTVTQEQLERFFINLGRGRDARRYLSVAGRVWWFRQDHPDWGIVTNPVDLSHDKGYAIFAAQVFNAEGKLIATATKGETRQGFQDFLEKAETGAVGRALALCGYGIDGCPDMDEGERYADSPQPARQARQGQQPKGQAAQTGPGPVAEARNAFDDVANEHDIVFQSGQERGRMANVILGRPADSRDPFTAEDWRRAAEGVGRYVAGTTAVAVGAGEDEDDTLTDPFGEEVGASG